MAHKKISNINEEFDLKLFLFITRKTLWFGLLFFTLSFVCGYLILRYTHPIYEANSVIQINTDNQADKILGTENFYEDGLANKVELLKSSLFLERVFSHLPLNVSYFNKGRILDYELYKCSPYRIEPIVKDPSIFGIPIYVKHISGNTFELNYIKGNSIKERREVITGETVNFPEVSITFIIDDINKASSPKSIEENEYFFILNNTENIVSKYSEHLTISVLNEAAKTIKINFTDRNAAKANDVANSIANEFNAYDVEKKAESANNILDFIDNQLKIVYDTLFRSEVQLENFKRKNNIDSSNTTILPTLYTRVNDFENQIVTLELEEDKLKRIETDLSDKKDIDIYKLISIMAGSEFQGTISGLLNSLQELLLKREKMLYEVTASSGQIESINYQIEIQKKLLIASTKTLKNNVSSRIIELTKKLAEYQGANIVKGHEASSMEYTRLQRLYNVNEKFYNQLIEKKAEYSISKAGFVSQNIILQKSVVATHPIYPSKKTVYLLCFGIAFLISFGLIVVRYLFYTEIKETTDVTKYTDVPIIGIVPKYEKNIPVSQLLVDKHPRSLIAEALRTIRTNLQFVKDFEGPKIIAVTSTISGEGKTFIAINLAGIIAFSNKKVIVLDLDMRKPKIHLGFNTSNDVGISSILTCKVKTDDCIKHSEITNLDFITAGPKPFNPSELIIGKCMDDMLAHLKTIYDYIIIDNPPVGIVTDGMKSMQIADYPIYIMKANYSQRSFIQNINRLIDESHIDKLSIVLNAVPISITRYGYGRNKGYGSVKSGHGYGYGYGYYEEETIEEKKVGFIQKLFSIFNKK